MNVHTSLRCLHVHVNTHKIHMKILSPVYITVNMYVLTAMVYDLSLRCLAQNKQWHVTCVHKPSLWQSTVNTERAVFWQGYTRFSESWQPYFPLRTANRARIQPLCVKTTTEATRGVLDEPQSSRILLGMGVSWLRSLAMVWHKVTKNSFARVWSSSKVSAPGGV